MKQAISYKPDLREIPKKNRRFVLLDTNFILTCIKQKIDFLGQLELEGFQILIPKQVIDEIARLSKTREETNLALKILEKNRIKFKKIDLRDKNVDEAIIKFAKENKDVIIATLDRELKRKIKNPKLVIRGKKKFEII